MASASRRTSRTAASMARLDGRGPIRAEVSTGTSSIPGGKSHSCDRPTSSVREPSAQTISVAEGKSEAIRTAAKIPQRRSRVPDSAALPGDQPVQGLVVTGREVFLGRLGRAVLVRVGRFGSGVIVPPVEAIPGAGERLGPLAALARRALCGDPFFDPVPGAGGLGRDLVRQSFPLRLLPERLSVHGQQEDRRSGGGSA